MVVDVDHELISEAREPGTIHVTAFDDECGVILLVYVILHDDEIGCREDVVRRRDAIAKYYVDVFTEISKHPVKSKAGT
jgi:hypothetical protein